MAPRHHKNQYANFLSLVALSAVVLLVYFILPTTITPVSHDLEDIRSYMAALDLQARKLALQQTLPGKEEVQDLFDEAIYVEVTDTCNWAYGGEFDCVTARQGPGSAYPEADIDFEHLGPSPVRIREGQVFPVSALIKGNDGSQWYQVSLPKDKMLFPSRIKTDWFVPADHFSAIDFTPIHPELDEQKSIVVVLHTQELFAYEDGKLFLQTRVSTGRDSAGLGTNTGNFHIFKKIPMAPMEGPLPSMVSLLNENTLNDFEYSLFVPFAMAFNPDPSGIAYIHGTYWHNGFGTERSHGCVNVNYQDALTLYNWVPDPATTKIPVTVLP